MSIETLLSELDARVKSGCRVWFFQANPKTKYIVRNRLKEVKVGDEDVWEVNQHKNEIFKGQIALIWTCGKKAGILAITEIISDPDMLVDSEASTKHYIHEEDKLKKKRRVEIRFSLILGDKYITGEELKRKSLQGTNFAVTELEWLTISKMIRKKFE
jgi:hypothetical protein